MYSENYVKIVGKVYDFKDINSKTSGFRMIIVTSRNLYNSDKTLVEQKVLYDYHAVTVWGRRADVCRNLIKKGDYLSITGELRYNKDANGKIWTEIYIPDHTKIGFMSTYERERNDGVEPERVSYPKTYTKTQESTTLPKPFDDDVPF